MKKMFIRCDDIGYSKVFNLGAFEALQNGVGTSADVMLDCPGTEDALCRLKEMPWISVGWHCHFWGAPVLPSNRVPTLVEHSGEFDGRFRLDLRTAGDVSYIELKAELKEELTRCLDFYGKVPAYGGDSGGADRDNPMAKAMGEIIEEYGITTGWCLKKGSDPRVRELVIKSRQQDANWAAAFKLRQTGDDHLPSPKWANRNIVMLDGEFAYIDLYTDSIAAVEENYNPVKYYTENRAGILDFDDGTIVGQAWHPGYIDYFVYRQGERGNRPRAQQFVVCRAQDAHALCSKELHDWIKENKIELVSIGDAIYDKRDYQNHLKKIGSDLAVL
ncbi:MAG: ChbG/HpnK family deacetylase [Clostridiales bacterium]|jgi:predicted glycoside hydrolase/deacetylase ChbG (UPF0249 family)|nr:ChbG/HpnK family deacetylase [Clostridiales bacterium]